MEQPTTIGIDLAKSVFQVHGIDAAGGIVVKRKLRRAQVLTFFAGLEPCLVGMEACAGAHFWARELLGITVMPSEAETFWADLPRAPSRAVGCGACRW